MFSCVSICYSILFHEICLSRNVIQRLQLAKVTFLQVFEDWKRAPKVIGEVVRERAQWWPHHLALIQRQVKTKETFRGLKSDIIGSSRLVTFHVGGELFIALYFPHGLLWDFDRKHMLSVSDNMEKTGLKSHTSLQASDFASAISCFPAAALQKNFHCVSLVVYNRAK